MESDKQRGLPFCTNYAIIGWTNWIHPVLRVARGGTAIATPSDVAARPFATPSVQVLPDGIAGTMSIATRKRAILLLIIDPPFFTASFSPQTPFTLC